MPKRINNIPLNYRKTLRFLDEHISTDATLMHIGNETELSKLIEEQGYSIKYADKTNIDDDQSALIENEYDVMVAFEVFENLLNPYTILKSCKANKIVISVSLRLWIEKAFPSKKDFSNRYFHEFETWQLDRLIEKTGYKIIAKEKWKIPGRAIGLRPMLRKSAPKNYMILAEKISK